MTKTAVRCSVPLSSSVIAQPIFSVGHPESSLESDLMTINWKLHRDNPAQNGALLTGKGNPYHDRLAVIEDDTMSIKRNLGIRSTVVCRVMLEVSARGAELPNGTILENRDIQSYGAGYSLRKASP